MRTADFLLKRQIREIETEFRNQRRPSDFNARFMNENGWKTSVSFNMKGLISSAVRFKALILQHFLACRRTRSDFREFRELRPDQPFQDAGTREYKQE
jgi:hypothetical protein